jgi:hypothetical protein
MIPGHVRDVVEVGKKAVLYHLQERLVVAENLDIE